MAIASLTNVFVTIASREVFMSSFTAIKIASFTRRDHWY